MATKSEAPTASSLAAAGIQHNLEKTAPSLLHNGHASQSTPLLSLDASLLRTTLTTSPKPSPTAEDLSSGGTICTDHMITAAWSSTKGWSAPELRPYGPLSLMPTASCLHYATECFEGMKLYRGYDGKLRLFRPDLNAKRLLISATRIALPAFEPEQVIELIDALCAREGDKWLPVSKKGEFLYLRPTMIATEAALGVRRPREAMLFVILTHFPVMGNGTGLRLLASKDDMCRAWPGGFGFAKVGANYGPTLVSQAEAAARGFDQILWLLGEKSIVTEAGASNFFMIWKTADGQVQLVTAPLTHKIILDGVTRRSIIELAQSRLATGSSRAANLQPLEIVERTFSIQEISDAYREGRLLEAFTCGTAWFVTGVREIEWRGESAHLEVGQNGQGVYAATLKAWLEDIIYGKEPHPWAHMVSEIETSNTPC